MSIDANAGSIKRAVPPRLRYRDPQKKGPPRTVATVLPPGLSHPSACHGSLSSRPRRLLGGDRVHGLMRQPPAPGMRHQRRHLLVAVPQHRLMIIADLNRSAIMPRAQPPTRSRRLGAGWLERSRKVTLPECRHVADNGTAWPFANQCAANIGTAASSHWGRREVRIEDEGAPSAPRSRVRLACSNASRTAPDLL